MTNAQTEAQAIARKLQDVIEGHSWRLNIDKATDIIATALAAKDAKLSVQVEAKEHARRECERAEAQLAEARKALEPFALVAEQDIGEDEADSDMYRPMERFNRAPRITVGHLRAARQALATSKGGER